MPHFDPATKGAAQRKLDDARHKLIDGDGLISFETRFELVGAVLDARGNIDFRHKIEEMSQGAGVERAGDVEFPIEYRMLGTHAYATTNGPMRQCWLDYGKSNPAFGVHSPWLNASVAALIDGRAVGFAKGRTDRAVVEIPAAELLTITAGRLVSTLADQLTDDPKMTKAVIEFQDGRYASLRFNVGEAVQALESIGSDLRAGIRESALEPMSGADAEALLKSYRTISQNGDVHLRNACRAGCPTAGSVDGRSDCARSGAGSLQGRPIGLALVSDATNTPAPEDDLPEQIRVRLDKRQQLLDAGVDPYPVEVDRTHTLKQVTTAYDAEALGPDVQTGDIVSVTGRVIFVRGTGKLVFVVLREGDGTELQAMISLAGVGEERLATFKALVDIGDHLAVTGEVITSRRGELSVQATSWQLAAKTVRPLPNEHNPLSDEARSRMPYVDMIVRPKARDTVRVKAKVLQSLRATLDGREYVEIETPVLQHTNGGAAARPFTTHTNAFDEDMLLRIAIELHLKRALVGGVDNVYEIGKTFRNEGVDNTHNPEFMMLEAYEAYGSYDTMADLTRELVVNAARATGRTTVPARDGTEIDLEGSWRRATIHELVAEATGATVDNDTAEADLVALAATHEVALQPHWGAGEIVLELFEKLVEHTLIEPTFVCDYPESVRPLAKQHRSKPGLVEAWDLIINGVELGVAFSELNDPVIQRERLEEQSRLAAAGDPEAMDVDEDFLRALEFGMPPAGGMGLGVDRLVMLLQGIGIREAILFPLSRAE